MDRRGVLTEGLVGRHLHGDLRWRAGGVVGVGLEARVHTARKGITRSLKSGLGNGMVLSKVGEDDHVVEIDLHLIRGEDKAGRAAHNDAVGLDAARSRLRRRGARRRKGLAAANLRVDGGPLLGPRWLDPDDDDLLDDRVRDAEARDAKRQALQSDVAPLRKRLRLASPPLRVPVVD